MAASDSEIPTTAGNLVTPDLIPNAMLPIAAALCIAAYTPDPNGLTTSGKRKIEAAVQAVFPTCEVVWSSSNTYDDNYAYIARVPGNRFFLAIRGSLPFYQHNAPVLDWATFANWVLEDFDVLTQQAWNYTDNGDTAYIASGSMRAFTNISTAGNAFGDDLQTAADYLSANAVANDYAIYVTGHSLGANMANVYASYFANQYPGGNTRLFTFAAPAAGDQTFTDDLNTKFPAGRSYHYAIDNDIVPRFPVVTDSDATRNVQYLDSLFVAKPLASNIDDGLLTAAIYGTVDLIEAAIDTGYIDLGINAYVHEPQRVTPHPVSAAYTDLTVEDWFLQAAYQHSPCHYLAIFWLTPDRITTALAPLIPKLQVLCPAS